MDIVVTPMVSKLVETLVGLASEELRSILGVPEEIQKLRDTLRSIQAVLNDAERRQIAEHGVKQWLSRLTDVMYDADDILDEYRTMAEEWASWERPPEEPSIGCRMLSCFGCFRQVKFTHKMGSKIRDLNQRLEQILAMKSNLNLTDSDRRREEVIRRHRQTSSGVEPDIVGEAIEKDTIDLVDLLMKKDEGAKTHAVVIAIVGLGGIGKTTLAQKIFNDDKIDNTFQKKMWVCVSQEYVETDLLKEIIKCAGGSPAEAQSKEHLESKVKDVLKDSKFMLVLDDIWDAKIWDDWLRKPLQVGAVGSRVLVTTRNKGVADRMKADHIHRVDALSSDDSWLLLRKKVTKNVEEERDIESLKDIGMRIVEKCQGLPLAITVIGGVLCGKLSKWEWEQVECNSAWSQEGLPEGVHQALYLSFEDLPWQLKQCLLYCSLFPEDSTLDKEELVQLWVAEGFVVKAEVEEYPSQEEIAQGYFDELIQRSLLEGIKIIGQYITKGILVDNYDSIYGIYGCKMHDLLRSLCHFLARGEMSVIRDICKHTTDDDSTKLRRLSIVASKPQDVKSILYLTQRHKSMRTLLLDKVRELDDKDVEDCFKNFQRLRVVQISRTMIQSLPQSIGNLLHLRYLNLSFCIKLKSLPKSIARLQNLQYLFLQGCENLHTIPKGVVQLRNLRTLNLKYVPLKELPSGIARLEHLHVLKGATVSSFSSHNSNNNSSSSSSSCTLEEICQLRKLRVLSIVLKTSARSNLHVNGLNRSLIAMKYLLDLELSCIDNRFDGHDIHDNIFDVALHPPLCVSHIKISNLLGRQFPQWLMSSSISLLLPNLRILLLRDCHSCSRLPPLGKLPNLESLILDSLDAVTSIGAEFFGYEEASTSAECGESKNASSSLVSFPHLKVLILVQLRNLKVWDWVPEIEGIVAMPQLKTLEVILCAKVSLPEGLTHQAITLRICGRNINSIRRFPFLKELFVHLKKEESLSLPEWLVQGLPYFTSLQTLRLIGEDKQLLYMFLQDGPYWPRISHIPNVIIFDLEGSNYFRYNKHFSTFETNLT